MSAPARLLALRVQGFKSFAERTHVEFGAGISAVVGPNGSGKSNLADALRWALGEQGRSLRTRKSEDVIWAGSERRAALGMADVQLVLDNADALLPVEYAVVELGRRLYRSGENDYLLNRQRVRLRDLVELLDSAHLAENAFLFIGQGMVDQALALRPEERRPLFEEVAGVRRHERRRRKAEDQLRESEANLARVDDILAELRPQARRLGQLAEQQASRLTAGEDLAEALVAVARARWHEAATRATATAERQGAMRVEAATAFAALEAAEVRVAAVAASLETRVDAEAEHRATYEELRAEVTVLRLSAARTDSELEAVGRDRDRLRAEREAAQADLDTQRRQLAVPVPGRDAELETAVSEAERALGDALGELGALRAASRARGDELAALRRAEAARAAEGETARRRLVDADRRRDEEGTRAAAATERQAAAKSALGAAQDRLAVAAEAERAAVEAREAARTAVEEREAVRQAATERSAQAGSLLAATRGRLEALTARLAEEEARGIARAARRVGGRRVDEDLGVDPALRPAVEAALGELARAYLVERGSVGSLASERGSLVVTEALVAGGDEPVARGVMERLATAGGGPLADAVRRDPAGAVRPLLARTWWVPDLAAALALQPDLPAGWLVVVRDGSAVLDRTTVRLGLGDTPLERRAELERATAEVARLTAESAAAASARDAATAAATTARGELERARTAEATAATARRRAEEEERVAGRTLEAAAREAGWLTAQAERAAAEAARARAVVETLDADTRARAGTEGGGPVPSDDEQQAVATWETRVTELRARRDRLAADQATRDGARRDAEARRARAEAAIALDETRIEAADRALAALAERLVELATERETGSGRLAAALDREAQAHAALDEVIAADAADRSRLAEAERGATAARERLRAAEDRARAADVADLEARLGLESLREQLLVELAAVGEVAITRLRAEPGAPDALHIAAADADAGPVRSTLHDGATGAEGDGPDEPDTMPRLDAALRVAAAGWATRPPGAEPPSPGRIGGLRRRFHELGAANPFAVEEFQALRQRLDTLEGQAADLREAIGTTRALIGDLDTMIATQFRATFAALESTFDARFQQLFGGGYARLSLTDPTDLSATGIEIVARPPGKKPQALAMLSGGERALTAVALLFAMLEVRPVPFCVLDEVDAALDEANVGRFTHALRELAAHTQFIVITHNRGTIEAADALYGVTVGDDSVSRVISLRLEEAQALADRQGGVARPVLAELPVG